MEAALAPAAFSGDESAAAARPCIVLADDHPLFRRGLLDVIRLTFADHDLVEAGSLAELRDLLRQRHGVALVLLDLRLPDVSGFDGVRALRDAFPEVPVLVISGLEDDGIADVVIDLGAMGFMPKSAKLSTIGEALTEVLAGNVWRPAAGETPRPSVADRLLARGLTPAQTRIICGLQRGLLNKQLAHEMGITEFTVKAHMSAAFKKLGVSNRLQALMLLRGEIGLAR